VDVTGLNNLGGLDVLSNNLTTSALNEMFHTLSRSSMLPVSGVRIGHNPGTYTCDRSIAREKGWFVFDYEW